MDYFCLICLDCKGSVAYQKNLICFMLTKSLMTYVKAQVFYSYITFHVYKFDSHLEMSSQICFLDTHDPIPKCSNLTIFDFSLPNHTLMVKKTKNIQNIFAPKLSLRFPRGTLENHKDVFFQT